MKHALRKYLSNRGSALFMVLSLMTALMVLVMAMYFSVVSSREVQLKVFNQAQAYRSGSSIADAIAAGLNNHSWIKDTSAKNDFESVIQQMAEGDTITTGANGFAAFGATGAGASLGDEELGAYTVSITRLQDEDNKQVYDIAVTTSVDGVIDTSHTFLYIEVPAGDNKQGSNIFTSTGYVPNDTYLDNGFYATDLFCDTENTVIGSYNGGNVFMGNIYTGGSLTVNLAPKFEYSDDPITLAIRGDLNIKPGNAYSMDLDGDYSNNNNNTEYGELMVGGDCIFDGNIATHCDIYVQGDLRVSQQLVDIGNIYVGGDLIFTDDIADWQKSLATVKHIYFYPDENGNYGDIINGTMYGVAYDASKVTFVSQAGTELKNVGMTKEEFLDKLGKLTETGTYYKWDIDPDKLDLGVKYDKDTTDADGDGDKEEHLMFPKKDSVTGEYIGNPVTIRFTTGDAGMATPDDDVITDLPGQISTYYFDWQGKTCGGYFPDGSTLKYSAVTIKDVEFYSTGGNNDGGGYVNTAIVFDTGSDPENQYIVNLIPNRDTDNDGVNDTFIWLPKNGVQNIGVYTRGKGSLVIRIPNGMTYQDLNFSPTMHETWFAILGGDIYRNYNGAGELGNFAANGRAKVSDESATGKGKGLNIYVDNMMYDSGPIRTDDYNEVRGYIHTDCDKNCTVCSYQKVTDAKQLNKCTECGTTMTKYHCAAHEVTFEYCAKEDCKAYNPPEMKGEGALAKPVGMCLNRIERSAVANKVSNMAGTTEYDVIGGSAFFYPNSNIFLVSCDENADIRLSTHVNGNIIMQNKFFGFIYAPYMTFKAFGGATSGGAVRFCGGLIVSDYIISDYHALVMCYPTYLPSEMMDKNSIALASNDNKDWKVTIAGH